MADISSNLDKMNDIEISTDAPITESVMNKIGANINGLIDLAGLNSEEFLSGGTFNVPEGITRVIVYGCGGGGGGGGYSHTARVSSSGGGGGAGADWLCYSVAVTPLDAIAIGIGSGGGSAANGGNTTFGSLITFSGGKAGRNAVLNNTATSGITQTSFGGPGNGGSSFAILGSTGYAMPGGNQLGGGGAAGSTTSSFSGGGGGGGSFGNGANGGNGSSSGTNPGSSAAANTGGGGGGAGAGSVTASGGSGGSGRLLVIW